MEFEASLDFRPPSSIQIYDTWHIAPYSTGLVVDRGISFVAAQPELGLLSQ